MKCSIPMRSSKPEEPTVSFSAGASGRRALKHRDIRVLITDGEIWRQLVLDPSRKY